MKALKYIFVALFLSLILSSCENKKVKVGREAYMRYYNRFISRSNTLKILDEKYEIKDDRLVMWTIVSEFRTPYDDLVTDTSTFVTKNQRVIMVNDEFYFDDMLHYEK